MANEAVYKYGTAVTLTTTGAATTNNQLSAAAGTTYSQTNTLDYPDAVFTLTTTFSALPTAGSTLDLFIRPLSVDGATNTPAPATGAITDAYKGQYIGSFVLKASTGAGDTYRTVGYDIPRAGEAYIFNNNTSQALPVNWTLKMTPRTIGPL